MLTTKILKAGYLLLFYYFYFVRLPQLNILRFIAAIGVVIFHFGQKFPPFNQGFLNKMAEHGGLCVSFFFLLSGYILTIVYHSSIKDRSFSYRTFFQARFARIYPVYFITFLIALACELFINQSSPRGLSILSQAIGLHAWIPGYSLSINFPAWSISVELFFYLLFSFLLFRMIRWSFITCILVSLFIWVVSFGVFYFLNVNYSSIPFSGKDDFVLRFPLWHLHSFIFGITGGLYYLQLQEKNIFKPVVYSITCILSLTCILLSFGTKNTIIAASGDGLLAPLFLIFILSLSLTTSPAVSFLSKPVFVFMGDISYGIYMWQAPVAYCVFAFTGIYNVEARTAPQFYLLFSLIILVSVLSYIFIEKPLRNKLRRNGD